LFPLFATSDIAIGAVDSGSKFVTSINDTSGKFATGINNTSSTGGKLPPVTLIPVVHHFREFLKSLKCP
jgi:hypothetical protein